MTRVLVTYATKHGSTAEIAQAIADELRARDLDADCVDVEVASLAGFDAVVLGSAVYAGRWCREARHFLHKHRDVLAALPLWIFSSGPVGEKSGDEADEDSTWVEPHRVLEFAESLGLDGHAVFGGRLPQEPSGFVERAMVRNTPEEHRDARDWKAIAHWADEVADALRATST